MSTGSFPLPRGAAPGSAATRDAPPAISSSSDAGPTPAATICWYRVHVPARSGDDSVPIGRATALGGGCEGVAAAPPSRRTASVTPASAASDDRCHGLDRDDVGLAVHELHQQPRELAELRAFRIGAAALGDFTGCVRDRRRRHLEQLGDRVADAGGWCATGPADLADCLLDSFEEIRERWEIGES